MSTEFTTDRLIAAWLAGEAPTGAPDGLRDHVVSTTAGIRPRPAWLARLKGSHMDVIVGGRSRQRHAPRQLVPILVVIGLLLALAAGALIVGSQLREPEPERTHLQLPGAPFQVITGDGGVYASLFDDRTQTTTGIYRLDESGAWVPVVTDLPLGHVTFVVDSGSIWASFDEGGQSIRWDARTGERLQVVDVGDMPLEPLLAYGAVWHPIYRDNLVVRVDTATGAATPIEIPAGGGRDLAAGGGRIWVVDPDATWLVAIDAQTLEVTETEEVLAQLCGVSYAANRVWALPCSPQPVHVVDPATGGTQGTVNVGGSVLEVFEHDGRVWMLVTPNGSDRNVLVNVDPTTLETIREVDTGVTGGITMPSFSEDAIWFGAGEEAVRFPFELLQPR